VRRQISVLIFNSFGPLVSLKCRATVLINPKNSIKLANCANGR
jgi:hypothetical protein